MAVNIELGKKEPDALSKAQDEAIEHAITAAFSSINKSITEQRINNLKIILQDIIEIQKRHAEFDLERILSSLREAEQLKIRVDEDEVARLLHSLQTKNGLEEKGAEKPLLALEDSSKIYLDKNFILEMDKILEEKKFKNARSKLTEQDNGVSAEFAVVVREKIAKNEKERSEGKVNKIASSGAVFIGSTCLGIGASMIITAGGLAAAGTFPIGLAAFGLVVLVGAGIYYAKKKRERIAEFLPALYDKAKNLKDLKIAQLDGEERQNKIKILKDEYEKDKKKNSALAKESIQKERNKIKPKIEQLVLEVLPFEEGILEKIEKMRLELADIDEAGYKDFIERHKQELKELDDAVKKSSELNVPFVFRKYSDVASLTKYFQEKRDYIRDTHQTISDLQGKLLKFENKKHEELRKKQASISEKYKDKLSSLERKSVGLSWYKQVEPYFTYWRTCIGINTRANAAALYELEQVLEEGLRKAKEVQKSRSGEANIALFENTEKVIISAQKAREIVEQRMKAMVEKLGASQENATNFLDYLQIEESLPSKTEFKKRIKQLVVGDKIKNIMLKIFYTHPSTVLNLIGNSQGETTKNIEEALSNATTKLQAVTQGLGLLDSLQVYFPQENDARFMLVASSEKQAGEKQAGDNQVALFNNIFEVKRSIMEINKTLQILAPTLSVTELDAIKAKLTSGMSVLVNSATDALEKIEEQFAKLDIDEEANRQRELYYNVFSKLQDSSIDSSIDSRIKNASFSDLIFMLSDEYLNQFATHLAAHLEVFEKENQGDKILLLKEFVALYGNKRSSSILEKDKLRFLKKISNLEKTDEGLMMLAKEHGFYCKDNFDREKTALRKPDGSSLCGDKIELEKYIKNNAHIYHSQNALINYNRGVLEELQKSLVLSMPEVDTALKFNFNDKYKRLVRKRRVKDYGIPYRPAMSLSMGYILSLFKSLRFAIKKIKKILLKFNFDTMTVRSFSMDLGEILKWAGDSSIPISIENAMKIFGGIGKFSMFGFELDSMFGKSFEKLKSQSEVLNRENQEKVLGVIRSLKTFLEGIPPPFNGLTFPDLIFKIKNMSIEIGKLNLELSLQLKNFDPYDLNKVKALKITVGKLNALKMNFNRFTVAFGEMDFEVLIAGLPDGFPLKNTLKDFALKFQVPVFKGLTSINNVFKSVDYLGDFPFDDFVYIGNCFKEFRGFNALMLELPKWPEWLKMSVTLERDIEELEKRDNLSYKERLRLSDLKIQLGNIKIRLEKMRGLTISVGKFIKFWEGVSLKLPHLPGFPEISLENLKHIPLTLGSFDDISFMVNFLAQFGGIKGINFELQNLMDLIKRLNIEIKLLNNSNDPDREEKLKNLKLECEKAMRTLKMFKGFNLRITEFSKKFPEFPSIPGFPGIDLPSFNTDFGAGITAAIHGLEAIDLSIDFHSGITKMTRAFSGWPKKISGLELESMWVSLPSFPPLPSLPSFSHTPKEKLKKQKVKKLQKQKVEKQERKIEWTPEFKQYFNKLNVKALDLDEIIRTVEEAKRKNTETKDKILSVLDNSTAKTVLDEAKKLVGINVDDAVFKQQLNTTHGEIDVKLQITLDVLYALRTTIAVINAIKRGDAGSLFTELQDFSERVPILQHEIKEIVEKLNMLKGVDASTMSQKEELLQKLASKKVELQEVKSSLSELKRLTEVFSKENIDKINYDTPPIPSFMQATGIDKGTIEKIGIEAQSVSTEIVDETLKAVQVVEVIAKVGSVVGIIQDLEPTNLREEFESLTTNIQKFTEEILPPQSLSEEKEVNDLEEKKRREMATKIFERRQLELNNIKKRLFQFQDLSDIASEIEGINFKDPQISAGLKSLGLSEEAVTSVFENVKSFQNGCDLHLMLNGTGDFESAIKAEKKIVVVKVGDKYQIYYKNKTEDIIKKLDCSEELTMLLSTLNFNDGDLVKNKSSQEVYKKIYREVTLKGGHTLQDEGLQVVQGALDKLKVAEAAVQLSLLKENINTIHQYLNDSKSGSENNTVDPFELIKSVERLKESKGTLEALRAVSSSAGFPEPLKTVLSEVEGQLTGLTEKFESEGLYSQIYDAANSLAIEQFTTKGTALQNALSQTKGIESKTAEKPSAFIEKNAAQINEMVDKNKELMAKFNDYNNLMRLSDKIKNAKIKNNNKYLTSDNYEQDVKMLGALHEKMRNLQQSNIDYFLTDAADLRLKVNLLREEMGELSQPLDDNEKWLVILKLQEFLDVSDKFYHLNNLEIVRKNLEIANNLHKQPEANIATKRKNSRSFLPDFNKQQTKTKRVLDRQDSKKRQTPGSSLDL